MKHEMLKGQYAGIVWPQVADAKGTTAALLAKVTFTAQKENGEFRSPSQMVTCRT